MRLILYFSGIFNFHYQTSLPFTFPFSEVCMIFTTQDLEIYMAGNILVFFRSFYFILKMLSIFPNVRGKIFFPSSDFYILQNFQAAALASFRLQCLENKWAVCQTAPCSFGKSIVYIKETLTLLHFVCSHCCYREKLGSQP